MAKQLYPTLYQGYAYLSMPGLKPFYISERDHLAVFSATCIAMGDSVYGRYSVYTSKVSTLIEVNSCVLLAPKHINLGIQLWLSSNGNQFTVTQDVYRVAYIY